MKESATPDRLTTFLSSAWMFIAVNFAVSVVLALDGMALFKMKLMMGTLEGKALAFVAESLLVAVGVLKYRRLR